MKTSNRRKKGKQPFPQILTQLMKERSVTIAQAAKASGVSSATIHDWREGASPSDYLAVQKLASFLGVSFSFLLTRENETRESRPSVILTSTVLEYVFLSKTRSHQMFTSIVGISFAQS